MKTIVRILRSPVQLSTAARRPNSRSCSAIPTVTVRSAFKCLLLPLVLYLTLGHLECQNLTAGEATATRPYFLFFASSIDRLQEDCEIIFESVGRADLSNSLEERLKNYRNFAGIDHTKPLGMMSMWDRSERAEVVFLPVDDIDELLKTVTFGVVGYHQVSPDRYEIERPGSPYYVLLRNGFALFADETSTIQGVRVSPDQLTRELRDRFDVVVKFDLNQIPPAAKKQAVRNLREQIEPWLQMNDREATESANLRRTFGNLVLDLAERTLLDMTSSTIGCRLDPLTHYFLLEVVLEAAKDSPTALVLNRWKAYRSEFSALVSPDVPAGIAINVPLGGLVDQILGTNSQSTGKGTHLNAGLQLVGDKLGQLTVLMALSGEDASQLNEAIPELVIKLEKSGKFQKVSENFDVYRGIILHSAFPRELPGPLAQLVGQTPELIIGQGKKAVWVGLGQSDLVLAQLQDAINQVEVAVPNGERPAMVRAQFQAKQLPELVASNLIIPNVDPTATRAEFDKGKDGFSITVEPVENGIRIKLQAEEGFVRLIGRDWVKQIEQANP